MIKQIINNKFFQLIILATLFIGFFLPSINHISDNLDPSWSAYLASSLSNGAIYGKDVIFTYGIFNQIITNQYSSTWYFYLTFAVFINLSFFILIIEILGLNIKALFYIAFISFFVPILPDTTIVFFIFLSCYWLLVKDDKTTLRFMIVAVIAILAHIKFTFCVLSLIPILSLIYRRHIAYAVLIFLFWITLWYIFQHNIFDVVNYLINSNQIAKGYALGMQNIFDSPYDYKNKYALLILIIYLLSGLTVYKISKNKTIAALTYIIGFFIYKESIVRADGHVIFFAAFDINLLVLLLLKYKTHFKSKTFLFTLISIFISFHVIYKEIPQRIFYPYFKKNYLSAKVDENYEISIINKKYEFPLLNGCSDLYPFNLAVLIASGNKMCVRPVFQSYSVYTPQLLKLNAEHLSVKDAPENIFWNISPIDNRYPTEDDSLSWPLIIQNYELTQYFFNGYILLQRKKQFINNYILNPILKKDNLLFGEKVQVNNSGLIWLKGDIEPNIFEKMISLLYKPNQLNLTVFYNDGSFKVFKLLPEILKTGFILSPTIENNADIALIYLLRGSNDLKTDKLVKSFSIDTPNSKFRDFYSIKNIELSQVKFLKKLNYNTKIFSASKINNLKSYFNNIPVKSSLDGYSFVNNMLDIKGWAMSQNYDSQNMKKYAIFISKKSSYEFILLSTPRQDVDKFFKTNGKQDFCGFEQIISTKVMKPGTYDMYIYITDGKHGGMSILKHNIEIK